MDIMSSVPTNQKCIYSPNEHDIIQDDTAYRQAALNIQQSFIVQAPAGSGKTTLLIERVLALLAAGVATPEECLCITFTQKAAAEMRERVLVALEQVQRQTQEQGQEQAYDQGQKQAHHSTQNLARKVLERDALLGWDLLNNPNRLRIQTIDSLCAELAQRMPLHSGLGSALKITETPELFYTDAARTVLESLESNEPWSDALHILLQHLDNDWEAALQLMAEMLSHRDQWLLSLGPAFYQKPDRVQFEQGLQTVIRETLKLAKSKVPVACQDQLLRLLQFSAWQLQKQTRVQAQTQDQDQEQDQAQAQTQDQEQDPGQEQIQPQLQPQIHTWPNDNLQDFLFWKNLAELLLTDANQLRKTVTERQGFPSQQSTKDRDEKTLFKNMKEKMQDCLAKLKEYPDFCLALQSVRECPPAHYTETQWRVVQALLTILPILVAELMLVFQKQGQVDFIEIALAAHQALGDRETPSDMALKLGYKTRHILVDEFQDTSVSQFLLLEKLTLTWSEHEGNTLFLVGDPMQSIYRFRRADVGLFIQAKHSGVNDFCLQSLKLSSNFRSHACIVDWVNKSFSELFPKQDDIRSGAIRYTPFQARTPVDIPMNMPADTSINSPVSTPDNIQSSEVIMHSVDLETEAEAILDCILSTRKNHPFGSMALLVRSRNHLKLIIPALEKERIPYQGIEVDRLSSRPVIQDLLSLSRALIHLGDKIAWLALLNSPYCGFSLSDLETIATFKESLPLFWSLQHYEKIPELSEDGKERCKILVPLLEAALFERERLPVAIWIRNAWHKLKTALENSVDTKDFANTQSPVDTKESEAIEESETFFTILRETAKNQDIFTIGLLEQKINDHYATPLAKNPNALQIMTIHKAKGLEFDTVLLAGLGRRERTDSQRLLLWEEYRSESPKFSQPQLHSHLPSHLRSHLFSHLLLAPIRSSEIKKDPIYEYLRKQEQRRAQYESLRLLYVAATRAKQRLYGFVHNETFFVTDSDDAV